ncbi:MAG: hypothetical protein A2Y66_09135 [Nitrospirae bacterium RBG_13_41_22]|nr:MAG: hypothetical protein A2Y66_09135 [Nitrospirae bacterium RBG_13_41_22]
MTARRLPLEQKAFWIAIILSQVIVGLAILIIPFPYGLSLIALIPLLIIFYSKPILGLLLLVPFFPNYPVFLYSIGEIRVRLVDPFIVLALISWFFMCMRTMKIKLYSSPIDIAIFLFIGWSFLSFLWTPNTTGGLVQILKIITGLVIYYLHVNMIEDKKDFDLLLHTWIIVAILFSIVGLLETLLYGIEAASKLVISPVGTTKLTRAVRTSAFTLGPDTLGFILSIAFILVIIKYQITSSKKWRILLLMSLPLMFFVLMSTFSRSVYLALFVAVFYLSLRSGRILKIIIVISVVGSLLFLLLGVGGFLDVLVYRIETFFMSPEVAIEDRVIMWRLASKLFTESPIVGNGIASFILTARIGALPLQTPHNIYLYTLVEYGLIGFMLFLFWGFQIMKGFMEFHKSNKDKSADLISTGMTCGFIIVLIMAGFRNIGLVEPLFWGFLGLSSAFLKVYIPKKNNESNII